MARSRRLAAGFDCHFLLSGQSEAGRISRRTFRPRPERRKKHSHLFCPTLPTRSSIRIASRAPTIIVSLADRHDVLTFDSAPLEQDIEVTGPIHAQIYFACDCRDADLWVRLLDVAPDGTAFNLMSPGLDVLRASYRNLKHGRQLLTPQPCIRVRSRQPDHQQRFSEGPSHPGTNLSDVLSEFLTQSAVRRTGEFVGKNAEGKYF